MENIPGGFSVFDESMSGFSGSDNCPVDSDDYMRWLTVENMSGLSGTDNIEWPQMENTMTGFTDSDNFAELPPVADMSGFSDIARRVLGPVDLHRRVIEPYNVSNSDAGHVALVNIDDIDNHAVSRSPMKRQISRWQPYEGKKANKHVGGVSQEGMCTADLEDQRSNLDLENVMPSSSISTQGITTPPQDNNTRLWVKVEYNNDIVKFLLSLQTMDGLKTQVLKRYKLEADGLKFMYKDEDGEMITIACDEDLHCCLEYFKSSGRAPVRLSLLADA